MSRTHKTDHSATEPRSTAAGNPTKKASSKPAGDSARAPTRNKKSPAPLPSYVQADSAAEWLASLEQIGDVQAYKRLSYQLLDLAPGQAVLDLGCGRGDDVRALAGLVAPGGAVTGVDVSPEMIAAAQQAPWTGNTDVTVAFHVAEGANLLFADNSFDAVRIDRVLQHVEKPEAVLAEARRVLRPGGRLVLIEPDWKMMALYPGSAAGGDDDSVVDAILRWQVTHTRHPLAGRQLGAQLHAARFEQVLIRPVAYSSSSFAVADLVLELTAAGERAANESASALRRADLRRWISAARRAEARGQFLACLTLFFARGVKPAVKPEVTP